MSDVDHTENNVVAQEILRECAKTINMLLGHHGLNDSLSLARARDVADILENFHINSECSIQASRVNFLCLSKEDPNIKTMMPRVTAYFEKN